MHLDGVGSCGRSAAPASIKRCRMTISDFWSVAFAEVVVPDAALRVGDIERGPVLVREHVPDRVVVVDCDRVVEQYVMGAKEQGSTIATSACADSNGPARKAWTSTSGTANGSVFPRQRPRGQGGPDPDPGASRGSGNAVRVDEPGVGAPLAVGGDLEGAEALVLASTSPQRRDILEQLGIPFVVVAPDYEEMGTIRWTTRQGRRGRWTAVTASCSAWTRMCSWRERLGKLLNADDAREMVGRLAGRTHEVVVRPLPPRAGVGGAAPCRHRGLFRRPARAEEIDRYVAAGEWEGRAGAYAVQGLGATLVERIDGDYLNVVGLPQLSSAARQCSRARSASASRCSESALSRGQTRTWPEGHVRVSRGDGPAETKPRTAARAASICGRTGSSSQSSARSVGGGRSDEWRGSCSTASRQFSHIPARTGLRTTYRASSSRCQLTVDDRGLETALEQMPVQPVTPVEILRVAAKQPLHALGQVLLRRLDQQMDVVVHQAIRMACPPVAIDGGRESVEKPLAVCRRRRSTGGGCRVP